MKDFHTDMAGSSADMRDFHGDTALMNDDMMLKSIAKSSFSSKIALNSV
jgi:hypothetical protein